MAQKHVLTISALYDFFKEHGAQLKKGENSYTSGYVTKFSYDASVKPPLIRGHVMASMKKKQYLVEMFLNPNGKISHMSCHCPRGQNICHHMAALAFHCHYNVSVTDRECSWTKKNSEEGAIFKIKEMYPTKKQYSATTRNASSSEITRFREELTDCHAVGFTWLLRPDATEDFIHLVTPIEEILYSKEFIEATDKPRFLKEKMLLTNEQILDIERATIGQSKNENWLIARKHRLTASRFGAIINAIKKQKYTPSMLKNLLGVYNLEKVSAVQWGRQHETTAIQCFENSTGLKVKPSGLWLDECGFLGASPDGIVGDDAILEVKCPYKFRDTTSLEEGLKDKNYIVYLEDGEEYINKEHMYYHQIQGQLYVTKKEKCYLTIWTPHEYNVYLINKDEEWGDNIEKIKNFFHEIFVPFLCNNK